VINLSVFFLLCYGLTTILRSRALHRVLFQRLNVPDALICYPGSIEKLKLLGATYLPTFGTCPSKKKLSQMSQLVIFGTHHTAITMAVASVRNFQSKGLWGGGEGHQVSKADLGLRYQLLTDFNE
jgi:hypothetical protein